MSCDWKISDQTITSRHQCRMRYSGQLPATRVTTGTPDAYSRNHMMGNGYA